MKPARVILADDYEPAHELYRHLLEPEVEILAAVCDGTAAVAAAEARHPDLMLLDIEMGAMSGFSVARWAKEHMPQVKIVFVTMHGDEAYIEEAAKVGADGYVLKKNAVGELLRAVRAVLEGGSYFPRFGSETLLRSDRTAETGELPPTFQR